MNATSTLPPSSSSFDQAMSQLNAEQHRAVTHPEGPILVVAGPGTGKTQVLATRVAWLLAQPDGPRPSEILCLTYTEAAAQNMSKRLLGLIGPAAHDVVIHTFHSFGQLIIRENADRLGIEDREVASEVETQQLFTDLIDKLAVGHLLRRDNGMPYYEAERLAPTFRIMKLENWTGEQVTTALTEFQASLSELPEYRYKKRVGDKNKGDIIDHKVADTTKKIARCAAAADLFASFQLQWQQAGRYDYDDMLGWAIALLSEEETVRTHYQDQYSYFLVDEYQDTNGVQNNLLHLVAGASAQPNVLVVGDDDQSVFRFQGACLANLLDFRIHYPQAAVVVLTENYRSSPQVLEVASALIAHNSERLCVRDSSISKTLVARHSRFKDSTIVPVLRHYESPLHEITHVAAELTALHHTGWPVGGCVVMAHDNSQLDALTRLLTARNVPFHRKRQLNVLEQEALASSLHRVLAYLVEALYPAPIAAEPALFALLHLECFAIPPVDMVRLAAGHRLRFPRGTDAAPWREWLTNATSDEDNELNISAAGLSALKAALLLLDSWVTAAAGHPVAKVLETVLLNTLLPWQLTHYPQPAHEHAVAHTLLNFVQAESKRQPRLTCKGMLHAWEATAATKTGLPLEQTIGKENAKLQLLTAHGAKGLEFERVWLLGCVKKAWLKNIPPKHYLFPPSLVQSNADGSEVEEARRLFFVALTRAQEHLTISFTQCDEQAKVTPECVFVSELIAHGVAVEEPTIAPADLEVAQRQLHAPTLATMPLPDAMALETILEEFILSATTLNAYLTCPTGFYYEHLLRVPTPEEEHRIIGKAIHKALEKCFQAMQQDDLQAFGSAEDLAGIFEEELRLHRRTLGTTTYERRLEGGRRMLLDFHAHTSHNWSTGAVVEYRVDEAILPNGIRIRGAVDRLDPHHPSGYNVVDYKTGNPTKADTQLKPAAPETTLADWHQDEKARGGNYWRQGIFYHLLLTYDQAESYTPAQIRFQFVQPNEKASPGQEYAPIKVAVTPEAVQAVLAQIQAVDEAIRSHNFSTGCGTCQWCILRANT